MSGQQAFLPPGALSSRPTGPLASRRSPTTHPPPNPLRTRAPLAGLLYEGLSCTMIHDLDPSTSPHS